MVSSPGSAISNGVTSAFPYLVGEGSQGQRDEVQIHLPRMQKHLVWIQFCLYPYILFSPNFHHALMPMNSPFNTVEVLMVSKHPVEVSTET